MTQIRSFSFFAVLISDTISRQKASIQVDIVAASYPALLKFMLKTINVPIDKNQ
jgi:hypothetical protein